MISIENNIYSVFILYAYVDNSVKCLCHILVNAFACIKNDDGNWTHGVHNDVLFHLASLSYTIFTVIQNQMLNNTNTYNNNDLAICMCIWIFIIFSYFLFPIYTFELRNSSLMFTVKAHQHNFFIQTCCDDGLFNSFILLNKQIENVFHVTTDDSIL